MDIEVGQIWNGKTDGEEVEVLDYIERNNAVRYKYPGGYVTDCAERFKKEFEFVRNKGDVSRKSEINEPKEVVIKADKFEVDGVDMAEYWCDARIKGMAGAALDQERVPRSDAINHPEHYISHPSGIECIEVTRHMGFAAGNVIKYLWRNGLKDGEPSLKDLKKAAWYLNDMIDQLETNGE